MKSIMLRCGLTGLALAVGFTIAAPASALADKVPFKAVLKGKGKGHGNLSATYDTATRILAYRISYRGLSGPATAAHFHGPAPAGQNAPVVWGVGNAKSPISGQTAIQDNQVPDLMNGLWYFNVHTKAMPGGEIRGQVVKAK